MGTWSPSVVNGFSFKIICHCIFFQAIFYYNPNLYFLFAMVFYRYVDSCYLTFAFFRSDKSLQYVLFLLTHSKITQAFRSVSLCSLYDQPNLTQDNVHRMLTIWNMAQLVLDIHGLDVPPCCIHNSDFVQTGWGIRCVCGLLRHMCGIQPDIRRMPNVRMLRKGYIYFENLARYMWMTYAQSHYNYITSFPDQAYHSNDESQVLCSEALLRVLIIVLKIQIHSMESYPYRTLMYHMAYASYFTLLN